LHELHKKSGTHHDDEYRRSWIERNMKMLKKIDTASIIQAAGSKPKIIEEFVGRVNSATAQLSIARMKSPAGWIEPGQTPEFDEYTIVLKGLLQVKTKHETMEVKAGQAVIVHRGEWVQYSTPYDDGAEYIAVCYPAFSPEIVHRDE
jgi:ethanolamine utilization protein EutQ (cupin superfamily)